MPHSLLSDLIASPTASFCGKRWIRTTEGVRQQIYSLPHLATLVSSQYFQSRPRNLRADGGIRTPDQLITNQLLWPTELHRRCNSFTECKGNAFFWTCKFFRNFFQKKFIFTLSKNFSPPFIGFWRKIECKYTTNLLITKHWTNFFSRCTAFFWFLTYFKGQIPVIIYIGIATLLKKWYNQSSDYPFRENFPLLFLVTPNQVRIFASVLSAKRQNELNFKNYNLWK